MKDVFYFMTSDAFIPICWISCLLMWSFTSRALSIRISKMSFGAACLVTLVSVIKGLNIGMFVVLLAMTMCLGLYMIFYRIGGFKVLSRPAVDVLYDIARLPGRFVTWVVIGRTKKE